MVNAVAATVLHMAGLAAISLTPAPVDSAALERGRRLTGWLMSGEADSVYQAMGPRYRESLGGRAGVERAVAQIRQGVGTEQEVVTEAAYTHLRTNHYYRISRVAGIPGQTVTFHWAWDHDGAVVYLLARPTQRPADTGTEGYRTKTDLSLPFTGEWYVFWGGDDAYQNYHVEAPTQRFAYDFLVVRDGASHAGDGEENADYYCFGRPILAPAAGTVTAAIDTLADNTPGQMTPEAPPGNHVVIGHGNGEFSLLAHFRSGSIRVAPGDSVRTGQVLGECGNSGNSSEPHVHYHLQRGPAFGEGVGLPAPFTNFRADGQAVERGEPVRGQMVAPRPSQPPNRGAEGVRY